MALERNPILPPGFYWVDVFGDKRQGFHQWQADHREQVKVRSTESHLDEDTPREWFLFEVLSPVPWLPATQYGFPERAKPGTTSEDTVQRPEPIPDVSTRIAEAVNDVDPKSVGILAGVALLALGVLAVVLKFKK